MRNLPPHHPVTIPSPLRRPQPRASTFRPSTRPPIPALTSTSTPAATGSRTIPFPRDQVRWARSFSLLGERNRYLLWQELDAASKDPKTPLQKKYGDFYAACMNTDLIEKKGLEPIKPALDRIAALKDTKESRAR